MVIENQNVYFDGQGELDAKSRVADLTALYALPTGAYSDGQEVYVVAESKWMQRVIAML